MMKECKGKNILLVEDDATFQVVLQTELAKKGVCVLLAENGEQGLNVALSEHPDLILLDLLMPKMSGTEMLKELRKDKWGKNAKVIVLTNVGDMEKVAEVIDLGTPEYFIKGSRPIDEMAQIIVDKLKTFAKGGSANG